MSSDMMTAIGVVAVLAALAYAVVRMRAPRSAPAAPIYSRPVSVIDAYDLAGREAAARHIDEALGKFRAQRFAQDINAALGVIERPAPAPPPPAPPTPPNA